MPLPEYFSVGLSSFALIALAEIGDKSQLVCMTLASRHRHWPVLLGAGSAFLLLNLLAVLFGAGVAAWVPEQIIALLVAILFGVFGIQSLRASAEDETEEPIEHSGRSIFVTAFLMIGLSEFGDKTQIAVAGLAGSLPPLPVWLGASLALVAISALGVWAGRTLLQRLPLLWLHRLSGGLFLLFASLAAW
ncbi:MAG: TMEM165/GDT1 family protein, partial [Gammaproteobacteria bacterium]|nr:TMEM165/GDT1 family protein [Gammaproteobacteria bacterium]